MEQNTILNREYYLFFKKLQAIMVIIQYPGFFSFGSLDYDWCTSIFHLDFVEKSIEKTTAKQKICKKSCSTNCNHKQKAKLVNILGIE